MPGLGAIARVMGRLPAKALGFGQDLPVGVYLQWRLWCTQVGFHGADPDLPTADPADLTCAMRVVAVGDDVLCPPESVWRLMQAYPRAVKEQRMIVPSDYGLTRLGHLGVLGKSGRACWPDVIGDG